MASTSLVKVDLSKLREARQKLGRIQRNADGVMTMLKSKNVIVEPTGIFSFLKRKKEMTMHEHVVKVRKETSWWFPDGEFANRLGYVTRNQQIWLGFIGKSYRFLDFPDHGLAVYLDTSDYTTLVSILGVELDNQKDYNSL